MNYFEFMNDYSRSTIYCLTLPSQARNYIERRPSCILHGGAQTYLGSLEGSYCLGTDFEGRSG